MKIEETLNFLSTSIPPRLSASILWAIGTIILCFDINPVDYPFCGLGKRSMDTSTIEDPAIMNASLVDLHALETKLSWMMERKVALLMRNVEARSRSAMDREMPDSDQSDPAV
eukprot:TRINITY_DN9927_c2_g1_i3.p1 TRINITY_DN9927_c2_g1~~TRINITY_DN9927_c2_g1_i3.p1  ORF type:complete len:113 (-),score=14.89 TRINITY_DN9927_c2_g1_i3:116-454(-)